MANHQGKEGQVSVGGNVVAELRTWEVSEETTADEDTTVGDEARTFKAGLKSWTFTATVLWDETDTTGQGALTNGASVTMNFEPEGDTAGDTYYTGTAIITGVTRRGQAEGFVEADITGQGTGALSEATV